MLFKKVPQRITNIHRWSWSPYNIYTTINEDLSDAVTLKNLLLHVRLEGPVSQHAGQTALDDCLHRLASDHTAEGTPPPQRLWPASPPAAS